MSWTEIETTTHQDHVIKHVIGATVLGWVIAGEAAHLLLDIGFLWTIYLDGEMNLLPQGVAVSELEGDDVSAADRTELSFDADLLLSEGRHAEGLKRFIGAPVLCMIDSVDVSGVGFASPHHGPWRSGNGNSRDIDWVIRSSRPCE